MSTDELAAEIVGRCRERIDAGENVEVDAVVRAHPEIAATLRERFDALARLDRGFGRTRAAGDAEAPSLVGRALGDCVGFSTDTPAVIADHARATFA